MKKYIMIICLVLTSSLLQAGAWEVDKKITGVLSPESVLFDKSRNVLFVSNQNYKGKEGEGFISKHKINGDMIQSKWITGLVAPKGMAIVGDRLFVSSKTELVEVSISEGKILKRHSHEKAEALNDVVADKKGNVYVSDMYTSAIYRLSKGEFGIWLEGAELENPNGLFIKGKNMYVSAWGGFTNRKPRTAGKGHLLKINMKSKEISKLSDAPIGNLDGVLRKGKKFILSDWIAGEIFSFDRKTKQAKSIYKLYEGAGDIEYIKKKKLLFVPMAKTDEIVVLRPSKKK